MLLANAGFAMGIQGATVRQLGEVSTTYLTGTLTGVIAGLVTGRKPSGLERSLGIFVALVVGACASAVVTPTCPRCSRSWCWSRWPWSCGSPPPGSDPGSAGGIPSRGLVLRQVTARRSAARHSAGPVGAGPAGCKLSLRTPGPSAGIRGAPPRV